MEVQSVIRRVTKAQLDLDNDSHDEFHRGECTSGKTDVVVLMSWFAGWGRRLAEPDGTVAAYPTTGKRTSQNSADQLSTD
jgi:hypothetical protein